MNSGDTEIARLRAALGSKNRHERAAAAIELGSLNAAGVIDELRPVADDPDDLVAVSAMYGCWKLDDHIPSMERMASTLASSDEESVQLTVQALCDMGAAAVPGLVELLDSGSPHSLQVLRVLADIGGARSREAVRQIARGDDQTLADAARELLDEWDDG